MDENVCETIPVGINDVESRIVVVRGKEVLLDRDVADLYGVETREVNQAVRNNPTKFREGTELETGAAAAASGNGSLLARRQHRPL